MTEKDLVKSWGEPSKIQYTSSGRDQWIYRYHDRTDYVNMVDGCVESWRQY